MEGAASDQSDETLSRLSSLTNQQARILELICEGKLNKQIAYDLNASREAVSRLLKQLERQGEVKLGRNQIELL